jgi:ketosteroid isomerase-like protein
MEAAVLELCRSARVLVVIAVGMSACGPGSRGSAASAGDASASLSATDSAGIAAADSAFRVAADSGSAAAVAAVYASDASLLPPNLPLQRGHGAIQKFWSGLFEAYTVKFEITSDMIEGRGDLAYNMGHYRFTAVPKSKSAPGIADEGKFVEILKKQPDGTWKYAVDIYNSNLAPPR